MLLWVFVSAAYGSNPRIVSWLPPIAISQIPPNLPRMDLLGNFYGADWVGMTGNLFGVWCMSKQRKSRFVYGTIGCVGWMIFGFLTKSPPSVISNIIYIILNIRGWRKWKEKPPQNQE